MDMSVMELTFTDIMILVTPPTEIMLLVIAKPILVLVMELTIISVFTECQWEQQLHHIVLPTRK